MRLHYLFLALFPAALSQAPPGPAPAPAPAPGPTTVNPPPATSNAQTSLPATSSRPLASVTSSIAPSAASQPSNRPPAPTESNGGSRTVNTLNPTSVPTTTAGSSNSDSFQLGTAGIVGIAIVAGALFFAIIAFFIIRGRKRKEEVSLLTLESTSRNPPPPMPGSKGARLSVALESNVSPPLNKPQSPGKEYFYQQQQQQYYPPPPEDPYAQGGRVLQQATYTQDQIEKWNAQTMHGIYTEEQASEWCAHLAREGYAQTDIDNWRLEQQIWTPEQIDEWFLNEIKPQVGQSSATLANY